MVTDIAIKSLCVSNSSSIRDAMMCVDRNQRGIALVVDDCGRLCGTVTDGDIRRALLGGAAIDSGLTPYYNKIFTSVGLKIGRAEVLDIMQAKQLNQIPIVDDTGRVVGLHFLREIIGAVERPNWAVIMAGGRGERLRPITDVVPKPMVKVAGRPILERIILHLVGFGIRRVFISVNYMASVIEQYFKNGDDYGCRIEYLKEEKPLGTGGAVSLLPSKPEKPLLVVNGDLVTQFDVGQMLKFHKELGNRMTIGVHEYVHTIPFGVVSIRDDDRVYQLREKPTHSWVANAGIYVIDPDLVEKIPKNQEYSIPELIEDCIEQDEVVRVFHIDEDWIDIGKHQELKRAKGEEHR